MMTGARSPSSNVTSTKSPRIRNPSVFLAGTSTPKQTLSRTPPARDRSPAERRQAAKSAGLKFSATSNALALN
jgi:hypothetical protein